MSSRLGRLQKVSTLVPLALVSAAWTANLAGVGAISTASAGQRSSGVLPDGTTVPTQAIEAPASVSAPGVVAPGIQGNNPKKVVSGESASGIPAAALAAYQRAETVINSADRSCHLPWQLVAAIGRVESDHGRANGNRLNDQGRAVPGIYGIALDGKHHTQKISDTDAGLYDDDARFDRAVGPMQFIPSTWAVVGVDGDNDGKRNPQDIDDAALATAVYLCSGKDDLATTSGQRASVFRYNHSQSYVDLVLSIMRAYMAGEFSSVPNGTTNASLFVPAPEVVKQPHVKHPHVNHPQQPATGGTTTSPSTTTDDPTTTPTTSPSTPSLPGGGDGGDGDGDGGGTVKVPNLPTTGLPPVDDPITEAEALLQCTADGVVDNPLTGINELQQCINNLLNP